MVATILKSRLLWVCVLLLGVVPVGQGHAQTGDDLPPGTDYEWVNIIDGLHLPIFVTHAGDGSGRLFVVEQTGYILVYERGELLFEPFLDISLKIPNEVMRGSYSEQGLLGLAFDPTYAETGVFYINYTNLEGTVLVSRFRVSADDANRADPDSETVLLEIPQPYANHNGGHIEFGPDGYLYVSVGDGGSADDPDNHAQNTTNMLGTILRLDVSDHTSDTYAIPPDNPFVDTPDFLPEIWAYGLRNPWRFSFDSETGDMYIGDVGQGLLEEIDFQPADSPGGENYGWRVWEGTSRHDPDMEATAEMIPPIIEYDHVAGCSVTGGYVYRGEELPELDGLYFYGDYCVGRIWITRRGADDEWVVSEFAFLEIPISSFGLDEAGELYMVDYAGNIYKLLSATLFDFSG